MPGKGNPRLQLRLPPDHWLMRIPDPAVRRREVERALEFYATYYGRMEELRQAVAEIRRAVREGGLAGKDREKGGEKGGTDRRLFAAVDKFLNP